MAVEPSSGPADREQFRRIRRAAFSRSATLDPADVPAAETMLRSLRGSSPRVRVGVALGACFFAWMSVRNGFESHRHGHWVLFGIGVVFVAVGLVALLANVVLTRRLRRAMRQARPGPDGGTLSR